MEVAAAPNISDFYPFLGPLDLQNLRKRAMGLYDETWKMWEEIVEERRSDNKYSTRDHVDHSCQQHDFLDALLRNGFANDQINILLVVNILSLSLFLSLLMWLKVKIETNLRSQLELVE